MHLLQQNPLYLINLGELKEAVGNPMGCISAPMGFVLQTPAFGVVSNVRRKEQACVLVSKRRSYIKNVVSSNQMESNMVVKVDTEFKSSFDEYLKAMESIRIDREKKQTQKGSGQGKKPSDVVLSKEMPRDRKHGGTVKLSTRVVDMEKQQVHRGSGLGKKPTDVAFRKEIPPDKKHGGSVKLSTRVVDREKQQVHRRRDLGKKPTDAAFSKEMPQDQKRGGSITLSTRVVDREKQQVPRGSGLGKKLTGVASSKGFLEHRKVGEAVKFKRFKGSDSEERDEWLGTSERVADKKLLGSSVQARNSVRLQKELTYVGSKNDSRKKPDVVTTTSTSSKIVKKKSMPMNESNDDNDLEMERFILQPSEFLNDGLDSPRVSQMEMEERIQSLARCLNDADEDMPAWLFAKTMRSARIRYSDHSIMRVIQILGKFGNWRRVLQVIEWLQMCERFQSHKLRYVYTAALDALGKARRPVEALNLFRLMQRHKTTYPDIVTYRSVAVTLGQAGHMKELFDIIDSMRSMPKNFRTDVLDNLDPRIEPDIVVYNAVLNGCAERKKWEGAVWVLQKLEEMGEQPSSATYGLAMEVMLACGKYDLVHEYFKKMQESSVPNALTYRVLVNTFWREGKPDEAIAAVEDMESRGTVGSASLYYDLARCLCSVGRCEEGLMQVDKICKVASKPLVVTYTGLIQSCLTSGNIHDAAYIFNHMQKYCSPNTVTCNIMMKGYLGYGMFDEAKELYQKMIKSGKKGSNTKSRMKPDLCTFKMKLEAFIREQRWDDFEYAYDQMLRHGHPFNTKRDLWMVLQASGAGKVETVETTWRHLLQTNRVPPPALVKERFRLKMENDNLVEAVSSVSCHPSSHQQSFSKEAWLKLFQDNAHCFKKEALEHLIREVNNSLSKSQTPNIIFQNLLDSCMEFAGKTSRIENPVSCNNIGD